MYTRRVGSPADSERLGTLIEWARVERRRKGRKAIPVAAWRIMRMDVDVPGEARLRETYCGDRDQKREPAHRKSPLAGVAGTKRTGASARVTPTSDGSAKDFFDDEAEIFSVGDAEDQAVGGRRKRNRTRRVRLQAIPQRLL